MRIPLWTIPAVLAATSFPGPQILNAHAGTALAPALAPSIGGCPGLPYSAKETQTDIKTNAEGTTTEHTSQQLVWRDADGRTRRETMWKTRSGEEAKEHSVIVYEPVQRAWWSWSYGGSSKKVVSVRHFREQDGPASCPAPPNAQAKRNPGDFTVEFLPPTTINGIPVVVNRNTKVVPAGSIGNEHEFTIAQKWWISPALGVIMRRTIEDPRVGKIVIELSDVKRDPPDPALFQVPAGYEMRDSPPPTPSVLNQVMQDLKPVIPPPPPQTVNPHDSNGRGKEKRGEGYS